MSATTIVGLPVLNRSCIWFQGAKCAEDNTQSSVIAVAIAPIIVSMPVWYNSVLCWLALFLATGETELIL
jgi:hypothetical protein